MKLRNVFLLAAALIFAVKMNAQAPEEWSDAGIFEQKKITPRVNVLPYDKEDLVETLSYYNSEYYLDLCGEWKFRLSPSADERPVEKDIKSKKFAAGGWSVMPVPGLWRDNGHDVSALVLAAPTPIPEIGNAVGTYCREVFVPKDWNGRNVIFHLGGASSAFYLWVNGEYVGYSEDSQTPSEFDITKTVKFGKSNMIVFQVFATSTGSLFEMTRAKNKVGTLGETYMYAKAEASISDYTVLADYVPRSKSGNINVNVSLENKNRKGEFYVETILWDPSGKEIEKYGKWVVFDKRNAVDVMFDREVLNVVPWSAETPNLYTLILRVRDKDMNVIEITGTRFGFRHLELKDGRLMLNGSPIKLKGVVRSDYGNSQKLIREDIMLMKKNNVNAVLTSYTTPQDPIFYELCDEYGLYVIDEANLQPYSTRTKAITTDPDYTDAFVARVRNMYERDKNHTSVIAWSVGNGSDNGPCSEAAYRWLKNKDKIRPAIYSGADYGENTDIIATRHGSADFIKQFCGKHQARPLILMEYGSTQGNSFAGMENLWNEVLNHSEVLGGFVRIWNETEVFDQETGKNATLEGLVTASRKESPALSVLKQMYCPIKVELVSLEGGEFRVSNTFDYLTLNDLQVNYTIFSNIKPLVVSGDVNVNLKPGEAKNFKIKLPNVTGYAGEEFFVRFTVKQKNKSEILPKGTELGFTEFPLNLKQMDRQPLLSYEKTPLYVKWLSQPEPTSVAKGKNGAKKQQDKSKKSYFLQNGVTGILQIFNEKIEMLFDADKAEITSLKLKDKELFAAAPQFHFVRVPTVNDQVDENACKSWNGLGLNNLSKVVKGVNCRQDDENKVTIDVLMGLHNHANEELFDIVQTILVYCTGDIVINNQLVVAENVKSLPRVGMQFCLSDDLKDVEWFGRENESYCDRKTGSKIGVYAEKVANMTFQYRTPQESGNRTDTRWMAVEGGNASVFFDMIDSVFDFSIQQYSDNQLATAKTYKSLTPCNGKIVNVDCKHAGVGSAASGNGIAEEYLLTDHKYHFNIHIKPFELAEEKPGDIRMVALPKVESKVLPMPVITKNLDRFDSPMKITLSSEKPGVEIRYTLDGTEPTEKSALYKKPFVISKTTMVKAKSFCKGFSPSFSNKKQFNYDYVSSVRFVNQPNTPYNKDSETALFDGVFGSTSDISNAWLGFSGNDIDMTFTLVKPIDVQSVEASFLHSPEAWAFAPKSMTVYVSNDGKTYTPGNRADVSFDASKKDNANSQVITVKSLVNINDVKYIRVVVKSIGKIPSWHEAKGLRPWVMVDEVLINEIIK